MAAWLFTAFWLALANAAAAQSTECVATPKRDLLPDVIVPMAGDDPVWLVETTGGVWDGADAPVKSVWILSKRVSGQLKASGRLRGSEKRVTFRRGIQGALTEMLSIKDPLSESMIPGGASPAIMSKFAFVASYIYFPAPGCWEITSDWGGTLRSVVVLLK